MSYAGRASSSAFLMAVALLILPGTIAGQQPGAISGRALDAETGEPLSGVQISVVGTSLGALSDGDGAFEVREVPAGAHVVTATLIGYGTLERELRVGSADMISLRVELAQQAVDLAGIHLTVVRGGYVFDRAVSAAKTTLPLVETPQAISVITPDRLVAQGVQTQAEALRYTAGVHAEPYGPDMLTDWTQIRGFQQYGQSLFRDGFQFRSAGQSALRLNPFGAERIEVVRGPASVLYGQSNLGGSVHYVTKRPTATPLRELTLQSGSYDHVQGTVDIGGPMGDSDAFRYRLTGLARSAGAQVDFADNDQVFVAPALSWDPTPRTSLTILGDFQRDNSIRGTSFLPAEGTLLPNPHGVIPVSRRDGEPGFDGIDRDQYSVGYLLQHDVGDDLTLRSRARYAGMRNDYRISWGAGLRPDQRTLDRFWFSADLALDMVTVDHQAQLRLGDGSFGQTILAGIDYQRHENHEPFDYGAADPIDVFDPVYGQDRQDPFFVSDTRTTQTQVGLYLQDEIAIGEGLRLVLGGRHDWVDTSREDLLADQVTDDSDRALTGRAGLLYRTPVGLAPYVSYSEAFTPLTGSSFGGAAFDPERGRQLEGGLKLQPDGARAFLTLAAFDLTRQNVLTADPDNPGYQVQTGEVRSRGFEVEGVATLLAGLDLIGAYTYLDTEITSSNAGDEGNRPTIVPAHSASAWAHHTVQAGPLAGFGIGLGVRHTGMTWGDAANTLEVPGYTLFDAAFRYDFGDVRLSVNGHNVLNDIHVASCSGTASCFYGPSRTVRATLRYRW